MNFTSILMSVCSLATFCSFELGHSLQTPTLIGCMFLTYTAKSISLFANPAAISRASNYNRTFYFPSTLKVFRSLQHPHQTQPPQAALLFSEALHCTSVFNQESTRKESFLPHHLNPSFDQLLAAKPAIVAQKLWAFPHALRFCSCPQRASSASTNMAATSKPVCCWISWKQVGLVTLISVTQSPITSTPARSRPR